MLNPSDTVVFLRMLEQFKIPAVMETRRKKLLEKLLHLQEDTIREEPPSYEGAESTPVANGDSKNTGSLTRKGSKVDSKISEYARIETRAKEEMETLSPKKKVVGSPTRPEVPPGEDKQEATDYLEPSAVVKRRSKEGEGAKERPASAVSGTSSADSKKDDTEQVDDDAVVAKESTGKKKKKLGVGIRIRKKVKNIGKHKSPATAAAQQNGEKEGENQVPTEGEDTSKAAAVQGEAEEKGEEGEVVQENGEEKGEVVVEEEVEEGVRIKSDLEKRVPKRFGSGFQWVKISCKLKGTALTLAAGSKERQLELEGCMVSPSDAAPNGIELFSHKEQKQWVFRVESEELRKRWIDELQKAIDECPAASIEGNASSVNNACS